MQIFVPSCALAEWPLPSPFSFLPFFLLSSFSLAGFCALYRRFDYDDVVVLLALYAVGETYVEDRDELCPLCFILPCLGCRNHS